MDADNPDLATLLTSGYFDQFWQSPSTREQENELIANFAAQIHKKYKTALIIGRFQPLHRGHIFLFKLAQKLASSLIIGIGSVNVTNRDNPLSAKNRSWLLTKAFKAERINVKKIVNLEDYTDDDVWLKKTFERTGKDIDIVIGNNDWVNGIFKNAGYKTLEIPLFDRERLSGTTIREQHLYPHGILRIPK